MALHSRISIHLSSIPLWLFRPQNLLSPRRYIYDTHTELVDAPEKSWPRLYARARSIHIHSRERGRVSNVYYPAAMCVSAPRAPRRHPNDPNNPDILAGFACGKSRRGEACCCRDWGDSGSFLTGARRSLSSLDVGGRAGRFKPLYCHAAEVCTARSELLCNGRDALAGYKAEQRSRASGDGRLS